MVSIAIPESIQIFIGNNCLRRVSKRGSLTKIWPSNVKPLRIGTRITLLGLPKMELQIALAHLERLRIGLSRGYRSQLRLVGVGYRALRQDQKAISFFVGKSHSVPFKIPQEVKITMSKNKNTRLLIQGNEIDKVRQIGSTIREIRLPDPYKGKGIQWQDEKIILRRGKRTE